VSIRLKLFLLFLALAGAASASGLWIAWVAARRTVRQDAIARFADLEPAWEKALGPRLEELEEDVRVLAADTRYSACMDQASAHPSDFAGIPNDVQGANERLTEQALHTRWGHTFVLLNDAGLQIIRQEDEQRDIGKSFADRRIVQAALHRKSAFEVDDAGGELDVAVPVIEPDGKLLGVALAGLEMDELLTSVGRELGVKIEPVHGTPAGPLHESRTGGRDLVQQIVTLRDLDGHDLLSVLLTRDLLEVLLPFEVSIRRGAWWGGVLSLLLAFGLGLVASGRATRPLQELGEATREIARGKYDTRVPVRGRDEIGQLGQSFNTMAEGLGQRVFFESALRRYLAPAVVEDLIRDPSRVALGGQRREMTVLFFDVAGFTSLSETLAPDQLVELCNGYLEKVVTELFDAGGTLDKFIGDAVMALFGVPLNQADHARRGCVASLAMQKAFLSHVAASPNPAVRALHARVGLHTGTAAFGNLGAHSIMSLTAMGDAVNLASRLEGVNKVFGTSILASEATARAAACAVREIDLVRVVGRHEPVRIFEVVAEGALAASVCEAYAAGLAAYRAGRFEAGEKAFATAASFGDPPARTMAERCRDYRATPPPPDWDGSFALDHK
jgi:class 3 adenylate cyclase